MRVRRVGYVPVPHYNAPKTPGHFEGDLPGYVGDPLFDEDTAMLWDGETNAFWLTIRVAPGCRAGKRKVRVVADFDGEVRRSEVIVNVHAVTLRKRRGFPVTTWFYADALCDFYGVGPFSRAFWPIAEKYFRDVVAHGPAHRANYARARAMLRDLAPWMGVCDALSEIDFAREGLVDMPIASIRTTRQFIREGIPCWMYFCCGPRGKYLNRLMDTPLSKIRMSGWLFYRTGVRGFLHWGYNCWYESRTRRRLLERADPGR